MAADVSSLVQLPSSYKDDRTVVKDPVRPISTVALMTRDLLGSNGRGGADHSLELNLDPNGCEKRLDSREKSGKVCMQQFNSTRSSSNRHHHTDKSNQTVSRFQDLNFPPISVKSPAKPLLSLFDDASLELKLVPSSISRPLPPPSLSSSSFQSVCTLEKVKSALARAEKDSSVTIKKRRSPEFDGVSDRTASAAASPVVVGCPGCLSYVLVMKNNPKCPRCLSSVPLPVMKKPRIDLNIPI